MGVTVSWEKRKHKLCNYIIISKIKNQKWCVCVFFSFFLLFFLQRTFLWLLLTSELHLQGGTWKYLSQYLGLWTDTLWMCIVTSFVHSFSPLISSCINSDLNGRAYLWITLSHVLMMQTINNEIEQQRI